MQAAMYTMSSPSSMSGLAVTHSNSILPTPIPRSVPCVAQQQQHHQRQVSGDLSGQHLDDNMSSDDTESSALASFGVPSAAEGAQAKPLSRMISSSRIITTEETVSSSLSSNSPQRNLSMTSHGQPPPIMSGTIAMGHESDDNDTMIDANNREVTTGDLSLVRPSNHRYSENNGPMVAITREESIKNERELETEDEPDRSWLGKKKLLLDDDNNNNNDENDNNNKGAADSCEIENDDETTCASFDIATFPTLELLEMLTALLDKIVKSNDHLATLNGETNVGNENIHLNSNNVDSLESILSFRGKHVPQISLEHYFQRIQKYCPTTNDVFLSLLVYFDRISRKCNANHGGDSPHFQHSSSVQQQEQEQPQHSQQQQQAFVMDSHNIHRLLIAGVTVSTKFFSDFFYSNSRYARVGGISLQELNHLELQFLVLCDFELLVSTNELQRYADLLYKFWTCSTEVENQQKPNVSMAT